MPWAEDMERLSWAAGDDDTNGKGGGEVMVAFGWARAVWGCGALA